MKTRDEQMEEMRKELEKYQKLIEAMKLIQKIKTLEKQMAEIMEETENLKKINNVRYEG